MNFSLLFHTIRYLKPIQIYGRFFYRIYHPKPDLSKAPPRRELSGEWIPPIEAKPLLLGPCRFRFLNEEHEVGKPEDWNHPEWEKLWLYNLHYFDDLTAEKADERKQWHKDLIDRWIKENPPGLGNGWEPYPTSLRIVNWIKWALAENKTSSPPSPIPHPISHIPDPPSPIPGLFHSLAVQTCFLRKNLEYHLLGNHLFANAKALVFAGLFFRGLEAESWLEEGLKILKLEVDEQILSDGGHFERSPMYHAIILEDLLDLINIWQTYLEGSGSYENHIVEQWQNKVQAMCQWLAAMCHPDGQIALFNDAAFGIAAHPQKIKQYACRLGLRNVDVCKEGSMCLPETGYIRTYREPLLLLVDAAPVGPDYLPGHAHADTLSFELSFGSQRIIVDSGTSCYGSGSERLRQRGTAAHNSVVVDGQDSSEVWGSFRVARRAWIVYSETESTPQKDIIRVAHDGYRRLKSVGLHHRTWELSKDELCVSDFIEGNGKHDLEAAFHFHPDIRLKPVSPNIINAFDNNGNYIVTVELDKQLQVKICPALYHPEFGLSLPNQAIICKATVDLPFRFANKFRF